VGIARNLNARSAVDFLHDVAAGFFPGAVAATSVIRSAIEAVDPGRGAIVTFASGWLWLVFVLGLAVSIVTGLVRLRYWKLNVRSGFMDAKRQMVVVKHSAFVLLLVLSAVWLATLLG
jgi:hypothetical protein